MATFRSGVKILGHVSKKQGCNIFRVRSFSDERSTIFHRRQRSGCSSPESRAPVRTSRSWFSLFQRKKSTENKIVQQSSFNEKTIEEDSWLSIFKKKTSKELPQPLSCHNHEKQIKNEEVFKEIDEEEGSEGQKQSDKDDAQVSKEEVQVAKKEVPGTEDAKQEFSTLTEESKNAIHCELCPEAEQKPSPLVQSLKQSPPCQSLKPSLPVQSLEPSPPVQSLVPQIIAKNVEENSPKYFPRALETLKEKTRKISSRIDKYNDVPISTSINMRLPYEEFKIPVMPKPPPTISADSLQPSKLEPFVSGDRFSDPSIFYKPYSIQKPPSLAAASVTDLLKNNNVQKDANKVTLDSEPRKLSLNSLNPSVNNQTLSKDSRIKAKTKIPVYISTGKIKPKQVNQTKIVKKKSAKKLTKQYNYEFNKLIYKPPIPVFANEDTCTVSSGQRIYMDEVKKSNSHDSTKGKLKPLKVTKVSPNETKLYVKQDPEMVQGKISSKKIHKYQPVKERTYLPIQEKSINKNEKSHIVTARRFMLTQGKPEKHSTLKYDVQHTGSRNKTPIQGSKNIISTSKINYSPRSNVSNNKEISLKSNKEGKYVKSLPTFSSVKQTVTDKPMGKSLQAKADVESSNKNKIKESWKKIKISNIKALRPDEESFLSAWKENYSHVGFQRNANTTKNKPTPSLFSKEREVSNEPLLPSKIKPFIITCKGKQTWSTSTPQELLYVRKKIRQSLKKTSKSKEQDYSYKEPWFIECQKNYVDIEGKKAQCKNSPRIIKNISVVESDMKNELYNNDNGESMMDSMIPPSTYAKILGYGSRSILESKIKDRPEYKKEQFSTFSVSSANRNEFITNEHNYNNNKGSIGSELSDIDNLKTLNMKESYTKKKNYSKIPTEINFEKQDMDCNDILHDVCPLPMSHSLVEEKALMDKMYGNSLIVNDYKNLNIKNQKEIFLQNDQCKNNMADTVDQSSHPMKESCSTVPASSAIPFNSINLKKTEKHIPFSFEKSYSQWSSMDKCEGRKDSKEVNINSTEIERTPSKSFITNTKYSPVQTVKQSFSSFVGNCPTFINKVGTTKTQRSISMFPAPLDTTQETRPKLKGTMESNKNPSNEFEELQKFYSRNRRKPYPLSDKSIINKSAYEYCTPLSTPVESEKFQKVIACPTVKNFKPHNEERKNNVDHKKQPKLIKNAPKGKKEWGSTEPTELRVYSNSPLKSMSQNVLTLQNTPMKLSRSFSFSKSKHSFDYSTRIPSQNNHFLKESHSFTMVASKPDRDLFRYAKNNEYGTPRTENFATFPTKCSAASFLPGKFNKVVQRSHSCTNLNMTHSCAHEYDFRCQYPRHASSHSCSEPPNSKNKTQMQCAQGKDPSSGPPSTDPKCKRVEEVKEEKRGKKICKKLPPPGCKIPEKTDCLIIKELPPCTKRLAPKQSYSECLKEKTPPLPFTECNLEKKKSCPKYKHKSFDGCKPKDKQVFICFDPRKDKPKIKQKEDKGKKKKEDDECKEKGTCDETEKCKFRSGYSKPPMKCSSISVSQNNLYPIRSYSNLRSEFSYRRSLPVKAASYTNCNVNNHLKNRLLPLVCKKEEKSIECLTETFKGARLIEYPEPSPRQIETVHDGPFRSRIKSCFENKGKILFRKKYDTDPDDSTPACPKKEKKDEKCKGLQFATGASTSTNLSPISSGNTMKYSISKSVESKELTKKNYIPEYLSNKNASLSMNILPVKTGISRYVSSEALITTKTGFSHSKSSDHLMKNYGSLFFHIKNGTIANISNSKENSDEHAKPYLKSEKNLEHGFTCIEKCDSVNYGISVNPNIMSQTTKFTSINKYNGSLKKLEQANNIHCIALSNTENSYVRETGHNSISEKPKDELENTSKRNAFHALNRLEDNKIDKNLKSTTTDKSCNKESFISSEKNCFKTYHTGRIKFLEYFEEKEKVKNTFSRPAKGSNNKCFPNNSESKKAYKNNTDKSAVESFKSTPSKSGSMKIEFNDDIMNPFNTDIMETGQLERNKHSKICCSKNPEGSLNRKLNCKSKSETLENNNDLKNESTCSTCSKEVQDIMEGKENVTHLSSSNIIGSWKQEKLEHEKCSKDNISIVPVPKNELNLCNKAEYAVNSNKDCAVEDLITTIKSWFSFLKAKQEISEIESRKQENEVESNFSMNSKSIKNDTSEYPKEIKIINPECSVSRNEITEKNLSEVCSRETKIVQSNFSEASNKDKCNGISKEENTVAKCNNGKHSNKCTEGNQCCEMKPQHATGEHSLDNKKLSKDCRKILSSIPSLSKKELFRIKKFVKQSTSKNIKFKTRTQNITPSACEKYFNHHKQTIKASKPILSMELNYSEKIQLGKQHRKVTNNLGKPKKLTTLQSNPCLRKNKSEMPFVEKNTISEIMNYENLADEVNNKNCQLANVSDSSFKKAIKNSAGILEASEVYPNCDSRKDEGSVTSTIINRIEKSEISFCSSEDISSQKLKSTSTQSINNNSANYTIEQNEVSDTVKLVSSASNVLQSEEAAKTKNCQEISCITSPMMKELGCTVNNKSAISYPPFIKDNSILEPNLSTTSSSTNVIIPLKRIPLVRIAKSNKLIPSPISKSKYKYALRPELLRITKSPSGNRQYTELVSVLLHPDETNIIVPLNISELADECATREKEQIYELNEQIANENGYLALIKRFSVKIGSALGYNYFNDISSEPQSSIQMKHVNCQDTPNQVHPGLNCILEKNLNQQYQETKAEENYLAHSSNKNAGFRSGLTYLEYLNQSSRFDIKNSDLIYGLNISDLTFCQIQYMLSSRILPVSNYLFLKYKEWLFTVHGGEIPYHLDHALNQYILYSRKILPKTSCPNCNILTTNKINYTESPIFMFKTRSQLNFSFTKCNMPHSSYRMKTFLTVPCTAHIIPRYKNTGNSFCDSILKMFIKIKINERHEKNKKMCENEKKTEESCEKTVESIKEVKKDCETKKDKPYIECKEPPKENVHKCDKEENKKSIEHKEECIKDQEPRNKDLQIEKSPTTCAQEAHEDTKNVEVESVCPPIKRYIIKKQNQAQKFSPSEVEPHKKELSVETEGIQVKDYCASVSDKAMKKDVNNLKKNRERVEDYCSSSIKTVNKSNIIEEQQQRKRNDERQDFRRGKAQSPSLSTPNVEALSTTLSKEIKKKESKIKPVTDKHMSKEKDKTDCPSLPETTDEYCYMLKEDCKKDKSEHIKQERKEVIDCSNNESTVKQVIATAKKDESKSVAKYDECKNDNSAHENGKNQERMKDETSKIKTKDKEINVNVAKKKPRKEEIEERKKAFYVTQLSPIKNPPSNPPCNGDSSDIVCPPCPPCPTTDPFCLPVDPICSSVEPPCPTVELPCPTESCKPPKPENPQPPSPSESLKPPESQGPDLLCQPKAVKPPEPQGSDPPCLPESIKPPESQGPDLLYQPKAVKPPEPQGSDPPGLPEPIKPLEPQGSVEPVKPPKPNGPVAPKMCKPQDPSPPEPPVPKDPESPCPLKLVKPPGPQGPVPPKMCKPQDPSPPVPVKPPELQGLEPPCLPGPVKQPESVGPEASSPPCKPCPPCPLEQVKPPKSKGSEPPSLPESSKQPKPTCQEEIKPSNKPPEHLDIKISTEVYPEKSSTMKPLPPPRPPTKHPSSIPESFACPPEKTPISKKNIKGAKEPSSNNIPKQSH